MEQAHKNGQINCDARVWRQLKLMTRFCNSIAWTDFIMKLEKRWYRERKNLLLVYAQGKPERLAKIEAAKTLTDMQKALNELMDESAADLTSGTHLLKNSA